VVGFCVGGGHSTGLVLGIWLLWERRRNHEGSSDSEILVYVCSVMYNGLKSSNMVYVNDDNEWMWER